MPQQTHAEIRILRLRTDVALQLMAGQKLVHLFDGVIGVRIGRIGGGEVVRHPRQRRAVRGQVEESDLFAVPRWHRHLTLRQIHRYRIVKFDLASCDHIGQQDTREHLGDGADLEYRSFAERSCFRPRLARRDPSGRAVLLEYTDDDTHRPVLVDARLDQLLNLGIGRKVLLRLGFVSRTAEECDSK